MNIAHVQFSSEASPLCFTRKKNMWYKIIHSYTYIVRVAEGV